MRRMRVRLCGEETHVAAPLGFLEDLEAVDPCPDAIFDRIVERRATQAEVRAIIASALRHGGSRLSVDRALGHDGWGRMRVLAAQCIMLAMDPPEQLLETIRGWAAEGNPVAPAEPAAESGSASA